MTAMESSAWMDGLQPLEQAARASQPIAHKGEAGLADRQPVFFVDVGGGHGHQASQLVKKYPALAGRAVLQDLPEVIERVKSANMAAASPGVEAMAYNFFDPQPVKGMAIASMLQTPSHPRFNT